MKTTERRGRPGDIPEANRPLSIRVTDATHKSLRVMAAEQDASIQVIVRRMIEAGVDKGSK